MVLCLAFATRSLCLCFHEVKTSYWEIQVRLQLLNPGCSKGELNQFCFVFNFILFIYFFIQQVLISYPFYTN